MMAVRRPLIAIIIAVVGTTAVGCTSADSADGDGSSNSPPTSTVADPRPHREPPIPGLEAQEILAAARAALPGANEFTFPRHVPGYRPTTDSKIGYAPQEAGDITSETPAISVVWEDDGSVVYVLCSDLVSAGVTSPIIAICTDLPVTGIPAGGLDSVWQGMSAGTWDETQPFPQVTLGRFNYESRRPTPGPAIGFEMTGVRQPGPSATATAEL